MPHRGLTIEDITKIDFAERSPAAAVKWEQVKVQAIRHTRGIKPLGLIGKQRPNESSFIMEYRLDNYRAITKEGVVKFNDKVSRIINSSGYILGVASDRLREWLADTTFPLGTGEKVSFDEYFSRLVMPCSFEDPNALLVAFPYNPENPTTPPANALEDGGFPANEQIGIKTFIVPSGKIRHVGDNFFVWQADSLWAFKDANKDVARPYFWVADSNNYYRLVPVRFARDKKTTLVYELQLWYNHDTGSGIGPDATHELPINVLGGTLTKDTANENVSYNESFLRPYFEFGDEAITTFSDWQAVRVKTAYPVKVMRKQPCTPCNGTGKVKIKGEHGDRLDGCSACDSTGFQKDIGPFTTLIRDAGANFNKETGNIPALEYVSPSTENVKYLNEVWKNMLSDAKKSINLDLLEAMVESGEAKKQRLQDLHDMLNKIAGNLFDVMELYLWSVECLLNPNRSQRVKPVIIRPISFDIKSEDMLRAEAKEGPDADAVTALMEYNRRKYAGNNNLIRIKELALLYSPLLAIDDNQALQLRLLGAYDQNDLIKRDRAEFVMGEILKAGKLDIFKAPINSIFDAADELMVKFLPTPAIPLVGANGAVGEGSTELSKLEAEAKAKLKGTVGGVQGIIAIAQAVATGTMTEEAAEALLMEIYGFDAETAQGLIDVPALEGPPPLPPQPPANA